MALTQLTKIDGGGISTTSDYRVGVITATKFVGPIEGAVTGTATTATLAVNAQGLTGTPNIVVGIITASSANFSGNVSIGGTLTYEDVTNIDSVGIITARNGIDCNGDLDVDGHTNLDNVSVAGVSTFASNIHIADSIIHQGDTDTKIDFASNQIKLTANNTLRIDLSANNYNYFHGSQLIEASSTYPKAGSATYVARFRDTSGDDTVVHFHNTNVKNSVFEWNAYGNTSAAGNLIFRDLNTGKTEYARFTGTGSFNIAKDLDVDGHTNLDNVSITGFTTVTDGSVKIISPTIANSETSLIIQGGSSGMSGANDSYAKHGITFLANAYTSNNVTRTGAQIFMEKEGSWHSSHSSPSGYAYGALVFRTSQAPSGGTATDRLYWLRERLRISAHGNVGIGISRPTSTLHVSGTSLITGISTFSSDLDVDGHTFLDNVSVAGVTTFSGNIYFPDGVSAKFGTHLDGTIKHTGSNFQIQETTGNIQITNYANDKDVVISSDDGSGGTTNYFTADGSTGEAILYNYGDERIKTSNTGFDGLGSSFNLQTSDSGAVNLRLQNSSTGTGLNDGFLIQLDSSEDAYIWHRENQDINFGTQDTIRWKIDNDGHFLPGTPGGYNIGSTSAEIGNVYIADNKKVFFGTDQDLSIYSSGTNGFIDNDTGYLLLNTTSDLVLRANADVYLQPAQGENALKATGHGSVDLYYDQSTYTTPKLKTSATGIIVDGEVAASQDYPNIRPTLDLNFAAVKKLDSSITYQRTGPASFINEFGKVVLVGDNTPRFDHDPTTRECKGLLIEESRTNLFPYGTTPGDLWNSAKSGTFEEYTTETTAPDGTFTATKWTFTNSDPYLYHTHTLSANTSYTVTMWVKAGTNMAGDYLQIRIGGAPYSPNGDDITIPTDGTWKRVSYTKTVGGSNETNVNVGFEPQVKPSGNPASGDVIYIWGAQLEVGSFVTSFIPTNGSAATRGADETYIDGQDFLDFYNQTEGTVISSHSILPNIPSTHNLYTYQISPTGATAYAPLRLLDKNASYGNSLTAASVYNNGTIFLVQDTGSPVTVAGEKIKVAVSIKKDDYDAVFNGGDLKSDGSGDLYTADHISIGYYKPSPQAYLNGHIQRLIYYPFKLTNNQLKTVTS